MNKVEKAKSNSLQLETRATPLISGPFFGLEANRSQVFSLFLCFTSSTCTVALQRKTITENFQYITSRAKELFLRRKKKKESAEELRRAAGAMKPDLKPDPFTFVCRSRKAVQADF